MGFDSLGMVRAGSGGRGESSLATGKADGEHRKGLRFPSVLLVLWALLDHDQDSGPGAAACPWDWAGMSTPEPPDALQTVFY